MSEKNINNSLSISTILCSDCHQLPSEKPHILPLYSTSAYELGTLENSVGLFDGSKEGYVYSRYGNPTITALEEKLALIECGDSDGVAIMTSSGMSAISTILFSLLSKEDVLVTHNGLYGGSTEILEILAIRIGFSLIYADLNDLESLESIKTQKAITAIYFESPSNPLLHCINIIQLAEFSSKHGIRTICDNTICTPLLQLPLQKGIDFVIYSTTKYLAGHGNSIAGCIISKHKDEMNANVRKNMRLLGGNCSPWEAWLTYTGLKTLELRMMRQCDNAVQIASYLNNNPAVKAVYHNSIPDHPHHELAGRQMKHYAPLMSFELKGGLEAVSQFMRRIRIITHAPTLGDLDTLVLHPDTSSHRNIPVEVKSKMGITPGLIRLSTGIEALDDLLADLDESLNV